MLFREPRLLLSAGLRVTRWEVFLDHAEVVVEWNRNFLIEACFIECFFPIFNAIGHWFALVA